MIPGAWRCSKRIGFLFPHPCERLTPAGCPDCNNGLVDDPYRSRTDRRGYTDDAFVSYGSGDSGSGSAAPAFGGGDAGGAGASSDFGDAGADAGGAGASADFTEADGESLAASDGGFEDDMSAS